MSPLLARDGRPYKKAFDEDAAMWRAFQKLFLQEWRWRAKVFYTGVILVVLGFLGQLIGSWPRGISSLGIIPC